MLRCHQRWSGKHGATSGAAPRPASVVPLMASFPEQTRPPPAEPSGRLPAARRTDPAAASRAERPPACRPTNRPGRRQPSRAAARLPPEYRGDDGTRCSAGLATQTLRDRGSMVDFWWSHSEYGPGTSHGSDPDLDPLHSPEL